LRWGGAGRSNGSNPRDWYCRVEPLPLELVQAIEVRSYRDARWIALPERSPIAPAQGVLAVKIGQRTFASRQFIADNGAQGYAMLVPR
jgi:hypothetical protein